MHLTTSLTLGGFHPAAALPPFPIGRQFRDMAGLAERGMFDAVWLGHGVSRMRIDPLPLLGSLIAGTSHVGLGAAWSLDHSEPFHVARVFATLDHLCAGRTAWLVGQADPVLPFRHLKRTGEGERRAAEFIDVVGKLWDSWEDEAFLLDVASGRFADPARVHPVHHAGAFFTVRGPLNVPRPVQGNPVLVLIEGGVPAGSGAAEIVLASWTERTQARPTSGARVLVNVMPILRDTADAAAEAASALDAAAAMDGGVLRCVGTPADFVDLMADWNGCCDGFNLMPAVLPDDLRYFVDRVAPLAQARGLLKTAHGGTTLREHFGLRRPRSRYAA